MTIWPWEYFWSVWRLCPTHGDDIKGSHKKEKHLEIYTFSDKEVVYYPDKKDE